MNERWAIFVPISCWLMGCQWWSEPLPDPNCSNVSVDVHRELVLADAELRTDARARNAQRGIFSFAGQIAALQSRYAEPDVSLLWSIIGRPAPRDDSSLPFRFLALVNRSDLAEQLAPLSPAGEGRLVYTMTDGAGDDATTPALPLTVIFEYSLGSQKPVRDWASAFHAFGRADRVQPNARVDALVALTQSFVVSEAGATAPHLSQIRVNDGREGAGRMYELVLDEHGVLIQRGLRNTPRIGLAGSAALLGFANEHAEAIASGDHQLPDEWLANSASIEAVDWLPNSSLEREFSRGTCTGCHGTDGPGQYGFHLRAADDGSVRLSDFLVREELPRRVRVMRERLCSD